MNVLFRNIAQKSFSDAFEAVKTYVTFHKEAHGKPVKFGKLQVHKTRSNNVVVQKVTAIIMGFMLLSGALFSQGDTTITRSVSFHLSPGLKFDSVFAFKLPKPAPIILKDTVKVPVTIVKKDTVYLPSKKDTLYLPGKKDTVFLSTKCDTAKPKPEPKPELGKLNRSMFSSVQSFIDSAIRSGKTAVWDQDETILQTIIVKGNIKIDFGGKILHNAVAGNFYMFHLFEGTHYFKNGNITQDLDGVAFFTALNAKILWQNEFDSVNVLSGSGAYLSSRGGLWDPATDSVHSWAGTIWKNSKLRGGRVQISIFSQDGPCKYLHLFNMDIITSKEFGNWTINGRDTGHTTHAVYAHPNVSLYFYNVSLVAGSLGLHHFSGGGVPGKNRYVKYVKLITPNSLEWRNTTRIDSSDIGIYSASDGFLHITNSNLRNVGSGAMVNGLVEGCTGSVWSKGDTVFVRNSNLNELQMRVGGVAIVENSTINYLYAGDRNNNFKVIAINTIIKDINVHPGTWTQGVIDLYKSPAPGRYRGPEGVVKQ